MLDFNEASGVNPQLETDFRKPTRWYTPDGSLPRNYDSRKNNEFKSFTFENVQDLPSSADRIYVLVNPNIYSSISANLNGFITDIEKTGVSVSVFSLPWVNPSDVRSLLQSGLSIGLKGAIFVGNIPTAWYEMDSQWDPPPSPPEHEEFPMDLYFMDLDGTWTDSDADGKFDGHTGNIQPEIWVGRIDASSLIGNESFFVNNYFTKNHNYRAGDLVALRRALVYVDDDWTPYADEDNSAVQQVYDKTVLVKDQKTTSAADYKERLRTESYEWVHVECHGTSTSHSFKIPSGWDGTVYSSDYASIDPHVLFYQFFVCSAARFTDPNYLAGTATFANNGGVLAIGSTKTGSMLYFNDFYELLSWGYSVGDAFREWFSLHGESDPKWFYGLTIIGDPLLKPHIALNVPSDYPAIQSAINAANPSDTIRVSTGTYHEHLVVSKPVSLVGENKETTIIDGDGIDDVIEVMADNVTITGFTIRNSRQQYADDSGVKLVGHRYNNVSDNNFINTFVSIYLEGSTNNTISNNRIVVAQQWYSIWLKQSNSNIVKGNLLSNNTGDGIFLDSSNSNTLESNNVTGALLPNVWGEGISLNKDSYSNVIRGNILVENTYSGISSQNVQGLTGYTVVEGNLIEGSQFGIYSWNSSNMVAIGNNITSNECGIYLSGGSSDNKFYHNNILDNSLQVHGDLSNTWNDGYQGNYWSDYDGTDLHWGPYQNISGSDGIGDTSYIIDGNNRDNYPLMSPYEYWSNPILGDINKDMKVDNKDLAQVATAYSTTSEKSNWNPNCDLKNDDLIDVWDLFELGRHYGEIEQ